MRCSWATLILLVGACSRPHPGAADANRADGSDPAPSDAPGSSDASGVDAGPAVCAAIPPPPALPPGAIASGTRLIPRTIAEPIAGGIDVPFAVFDT